MPAWLNGLAASCVGRRAFLGPAPGVGDLGRAERRRRRARRLRGLRSRGVGLDEQDVAALADGVRGLDVERDLETPAGGLFGFFLFWRRCLRAVSSSASACGNGSGEASPVLVDLREAAVAGRACRQAEFFVVVVQVGFGGGVVVGVDDRDRLRRRGARGERVGAVQVLGRRPKLPGCRRGRGGCGGGADDPQRVRVRARRGGERGRACSAMQPAWPGARARRPPSRRSRRPGAATTVAPAAGATPQRAERRPRRRRARSFVACAGPWRLARRVMLGAAPRS